jgi:hypothetical protein
LNRPANLLLAAVLLLGLYCPSSIAGQQSRWLWALPGVAVVAALGLLILVRGTRPAQLACAAAAMGFLLFFTLVTPTWSFSPGALLPYTALCLLLCANIAEIDYGPALRTCWLVLNTVNIGCSVLVIAGYQPMKDFLIANYSAFYDVLVPRMLDAGKPVLVFGSHSVAAFFFFVCFFVHLKSFSVKRSMWSLSGAFVYLVLLMSLKSVSAYLLVLGGIGLMVNYTWGRTAILVGCGAVVVAGIAALVIPPAQWRDAASSMENIWTAPESGFQGRYSEFGVLAANLRHIGSHPLRGIGVGYSESLWYGDSGPTELWIRGSFPLLLALYCGFWFFLRHNVASKDTAVAVFLIYLGFEIAYSNLLYLRTVCILPFVVVRLNGLTRPCCA